MITGTERRWRQKVNTREEWVSVVKDVKVFRGPRSQGISIILCCSKGERCSNESCFEIRAERILMKLRAIGSYRTLQEGMSKFFVLRYGLTFLGPVFMLGLYISIDIDTCH
jgi:hypothetical protein